MRVSPTLRVNIFYLPTGSAGPSTVVFLRALVAPRVGGARVRHAERLAALATISPSFIAAAL